MTTRVQTRAVLKRKRAETVTSENDYWIWGVIFTTAALAALSLAIVFSVAIG